MIHLQINENTPLGRFIAAHAKRSGRGLEAVASDVTQENFEVGVRALHERLVAGDFSQGTFADMMSIGCMHPIRLLEDMELQVGPKARWEKRAG